MLITDLDQFKKLGVDPEYPTDRRVLYSPIDDVHEALRTIVASCTKSLILSMYGFDDDELAGMIAHLLERPNIYCQISLDRSQAGGVHERQILAKWKAEYESNSVAIGNSEKGAIAHRKMLVVDDLWVVTGSTNWSESGESKQDNEMTVQQNRVIASEARHILDLSHSAMLTQMAKRRPTYNLNVEPPKTAGMPGASLNTHGND